MALTVCSIIVTFNRKQLLLRCLNAVLAQSRKPQHIIIVDNASTDGTEITLAEQGYLKKTAITYHRLPENLGGAGGFHHGIKLAHTQGFDYCWLMDDDGFPSERCLEELLPFIDQYDFFGPLVLDEKNQEMLCFPIRLPVKLKLLRSAKDAFNHSENGILNDTAIPFNGILLNLSIIIAVGLPRADFFIWGDDIEYLQRILKAEGKVATICHAKFYHPSEKSLGESMLFGLLHFNDTSSSLKLYCMCRNNISNLLQYKGKSSAFIFILKCLWFYTFTKPSTKKLILSIRAIAHGIRGKFSYHRIYLNEE